MTEFLPLCDVLFNVISLAGYFCDVVFDVVMSYALLERGYTATFAVSVTIIGSSLVISQIVSLRWYLQFAWREIDADERKVRRSRRLLPILLHCLQLGVLWRYAKLFVPVDLRYVKHEVRNLCMLRLVHGFCEAAPMLLLQLHALAALYNTPPPAPTPHIGPIRSPPQNQLGNKAFTELNVISASLSLFSVCWALASFSKNVRLQNVHRLVLTWLGVIFQFLWRLGTISARVTALTAYASLYEHWVFLVIGLHWVSMFLWLISPKNVFHGERISRPRKAYLSALIAFVYVFAYINLQEVNHRQKMVTFYAVMVVENCLLVCVWAWGSWGAGTLPPRQLAALPALVLAEFTAGIAFMLLYYRYFHVRRLGYDVDGHLPGVRDDGNGQTSKNGVPGVGSGTNNGTGAIPGVFNCRFSNPVAGGANKRKKKKPTTFVPPPGARAPAPRPAPAPFWRRPLPGPHQHHGNSSENEGSSVGSRVNIQQKLQEKKQKQLAELRVIEEEIKQGKLANNAPASVDEIYSSLQRQPIPRTKKHIDLEPLNWTPPSPGLASLGKAFQNLNALAESQNPQAPKLYDRLTDMSILERQNGGYENFPIFPQSGNLMGQLLGGFSSYTQLKNQTNASNYETPQAQSNRNMSPASQTSNGDQNSLTRQILPRSNNVRQLIMANSSRSINMYNPPDIQTRLPYSEANSPRTVIQSESNSRPAIRNSNYLGLTERFEGNPQTISPRNVLDVSPRTVYSTDTTGSAGNSYERQLGKQNRLPDINARPTNLVANDITNEHGRPFCDIYSVGGLENPTHKLNPHILHYNQRSEIQKCSEYHELLQPFQDKPSNIHTQNSLDNIRSVYTDSNGRICDVKPALGFPYQLVPPPRAKLDPANGTDQPRKMERCGNRIMEHPRKLERCGNGTEHPRKLQRCKTPEILLAPHYLEGCSRQACCHWSAPYRNKEEECELGVGVGAAVDGMSSGEHSPTPDPAHRPPSDIDSQISLPRSYTLPREFKYHRRGRALRPPRPQNFIHSTNSSDGDVDSGGDDEMEWEGRSGGSQGSTRGRPPHHHQHAASHTHAPTPAPRPPRPRVPIVKHETKL